MRILTILTLIISIQGATAQGTKDIWLPILNKGDLATYFSGMWEKLGIHIEETDEEFTVLHKGDHFELKDGAHRDSVDYFVKIELQDVKNMKTHGEDGVIDDEESFKIMSTLFTPFVRATLKHPMMNKSFQMKLANIENHIHVYLRGPDSTKVASHTLIFLNKQWLVIEGIHGDAKRVFDMTVQEAIEYQREAFRAQKIDTRKSWRQYKKYYLKWRKGVSTKLD